MQIRCLDALTLAAVPSAVACARMFTSYTLGKWGAHAAVEPAVHAAEVLTAKSVESTGAQDLGIRTEHLSLIRVRLVGLQTSVLVEVWDGEPEPYELPTIPGVMDQGFKVTPYGGKTTYAEISVYGTTRSGLPKRQERVRPQGTLNLPPMEVLQQVRDGLENLTFEEDTDADDRHPEDCLQG